MLSKIDNCNQVLFNIVNFWNLDEKFCNFVCFYFRNFFLSNIAFWPRFYCPSILPYPNFYTLQDPLLGFPEPHVAIRLGTYINTWLAI